MLDAHIVRPGKRYRRLADAGVLAFTGTVGWAVLSLPADAPGLFHKVDTHLPESGVDSAVTAVLLNFRAYDTLLEIGVLFVAVLGMLAIRVGSREPMHAKEVVSPVLLALVHFLMPIMIILAGYLLWAGSSRPGGAFQAGAVLGAAAILLQIADQLRVGGVGPKAEKGALAVGVGVFAGVGALCMVWGGGFLDYPPAYAKHLILLIEVAGAIAIGATFMVLFAGHLLGKPVNAAEGGVAEPPS